MKIENPIRIFKNWLFKIPIQKTSSHLFFPTFSIFQLLPPPKNSKISKLQLHLNPLFLKLFHLILNYNANNFSQCCPKFVRFILPSIILMIFRLESWEINVNFNSKSCFVRVNNLKIEVETFGWEKSHFLDL